MKILGIETSCDETALALVEANGGLRSPHYKVLKNIVSSQVKIHAPWGGVVPNLAKREHIKNLPVLFKRLGIKKVDAVAVTVGPGLEPALWTGVNFAKEIHTTHFPKSKLLGVNHLEGHLYSFLLGKEKFKSRMFPAIGLVVSGGHTILVHMTSLTKWKKIGETRDDAVGEAFDKVARMLGLPYPGGPEIERLAKMGNPSAIPFPRPMIHSKDFDFSFSGLKTSVLYYLRDNKKYVLADVVASFQEAAIQVLVEKTLRAAGRYKAKSILLSGGVAANSHLRNTLQKQAKKNHLEFFVSPKKFNTDNATMIAVAGHLTLLKKKNLAMRAQANLNL